MVALLLSVMGAKATPTTTTLEVNGGWSYARTGQVDVAFTGWGHFNVANVGDIDVANYKSIELTYSGLSGRFKMATIGTVGEDANHSMEESAVINGETAPSGSVTITFNTENYTNNTYKSSATVIPRIDLINQDGSAASITIESVILTANDNKTYEMGYAVAWNCTPTYQENKYTFQRWGKMGEESWATTFNTGEVHRYVIEFDEAIPAGFQLYATLVEGSTEKPHVWIQAGATKATIDINADYKKVTLYYDVENSLGTVKIKSITRTIFGSSDITTTELAKDLTFTSNRKRLDYNDQPVALKTAKIGDVIRATYTTTNQWNNIIRFENSNWTAFDNNATGKSHYDVGDVCTFDYQIPSAQILQRIQEEGIIIYGENVSVSKLELLTDKNSYDIAPVEMTSAGVATYCSPKILNFAGSGLTAYVAKSAAAGSVTLEEISVVPANTGIILIGDEGSYEIPIAASGDSFTTNLLVGNPNRWAISVYESAAFTGDKYRYILAKNNDEKGFYKVTADGLTNTESKSGSSYYGKKYYELAAHKAYLETTDDITPTTSRVALVFDDGETTGIQELENSSIEELNHSGNEALKAYYNLNGQRVANPRRGLYIVNGKKVIIK